MKFWIIALIFFVSDRITKALVIANMSPDQSIPVIQDFFHITYIRNSGAAFGFLNNKTWLFIIVTLLVVGFMIYLVCTTFRHDQWMEVTLGMISGGALGNLADRIQTGLVIDFIDFNGIWSYIFNIADIGIVVGVILLAWRIFRMDA